MRTQLLHSLLSRTVATLLGASLAIMPVAPVSAATQESVLQINGGQASGKRINLGLNKSLVIDLPADAYDILVANPGVADAVTRTSRRIYLFGKSVGQTNVFVFGPNGEQIANLDISIERDVTSLSANLRKFIPDSDITVELINDNVVLTGTVQTPLDAKRAADLARAFVSGGEATTGQYSTNSSASATGGGTAINIGDQDEARRESRIVNLLQIIGEDQVTLKVTVAEVSRTVMKQLGINLLGQHGSDGIISQNISGAVGQALSASGGALSGSIGSVNIDAYLNAMELAGVMKTLAEPSLTAISGEKATFKVGGQFNLISGQSVEVNEVTGKENLSTTHDQIEYGIGLEFLPVVLSPGRISLKIRTAVSEPTLESSVTMGRGIANPSGVALSIRKRLADTTVELPSGGSMMIAGLIRDDVRQTISGYPGLAKIPVLGTLFRSRDFVRNETELVVIVTPYLVRPVARTALARPDDNFNPPSDAAGILLGKVNRVYGTAETSLPPGRYHGVVGYIYK